MGFLMPVAITLMLYVTFTMRASRQQREAASTENARIMQILEETSSLASSVTIAPARIIGEQGEEENDNEEDYHDGRSDQVLLPKRRRRYSHRQEPQQQQDEVEIVVEDKENAKPQQHKQQEDDAEPEEPPPPHKHLDIHQSEQSLSQQQQQRRQLSLQPPPPQNATERYAYVTSLFLGTKYICGAVMLAWTLRHRHPDIDLVALVAGHLSPHDEPHLHALETLRRVGYKIVEAPLLLNHYEQRAAGSHGALERRSFLFSKLNLYALTEYTKILFVDADVFLINSQLSQQEQQHDSGGDQPQPPLSDQLFKRHDAVKPAGHFFLPGEINVGFMLARPSMKTYWDMLTKFNTIHAVKTGDQDFQNQYWNHPPHEGFEEMSSLDHQFRDFNNLRWPFYKEDETTAYNRVDAPLDKGFRIYHPFGLKPWNCPRNVYCETNEERGMKYIWPQVTDLWWNEFDDMASAWPWLTQEPEAASYCLTTKIPAKWFRMTPEQLEEGRNKARQEEAHHKHKQQFDDDDNSGVVEKG